MVLHHIKSLSFKPLHLVQSGVFKVHTAGLHKSERIEPHISLCRDLVVELTDRTAAEIPRIFILCISVPDLLIDLLKVFIRDDCFAP